MKIKRIAILPIAGLALAAAFFQLNNASAVVDTSWGPQDRATYTWDKPADHVTFNSITDNPFLGDERNFVRVREAGSEESAVDEVTLEPGKEYQISIYYHNDASASLNSSGAGISRNTFLRTEFPSYLNAGEIGVATAFISASNSEPQTVWDTTYLKAASSVYLSFVPNSAVIHNNGTTDGTVLSGDALLGDKGVTLGHYDNMWGMIPGCNEYGGYVTYKIRVDAPSFSVDKQVALSDLPDNFKDEIIALPGDTLNFRIYYHNTGTTEQTGVTAHDFLPSGLNYIAGSTWASSTRHPEPTQSPEVLFTEGLGLGAMIAGEEAWVTYSAKIADDMSLFPCGDTEIYNGAYVASNSGQNGDKVKIIVRRACANPTPSTLPTTGPGEIAMAVAIVVVIGGGIIYFYRSQKMLRKVVTGVNGTEMTSSNNVGSVVNDANKATNGVPGNNMADSEAKSAAESTVNESSNRNSSDIVREGIENKTESK